jgi:hypothetical protein
MRVQVHVEMRDVCTPYLPTTYSVAGKIGGAENPRRPCVHRASSGVFWGRRQWRAGTSRLHRQSLAMPQSVLLAALVSIFPSLLSGAERVYHWPLQGERAADLSDRRLETVEPCTVGLCPRGCFDRVAEACRDRGRDTSGVRRRPRSLCG